MNCRSLCKFSRVSSTKIFHINHFKKYQSPLRLINCRYIQHSQTTDMENLDQNPDTDNTNYSENNRIRDSTKSKKDIEDNFNRNAQNIKKTIQDNYGNLKSNVNDTYENTKENVKDNYQNVKSNIKDNYENAKESAKEKSKSKFENMKENVNENYKNAKEKIKDSYNQFKDNYETKFNNTTQNLKEGVQNIKEGVQNAKHNVEEEIEDTTEEVKKKYDETKKKAQDKAHEKKEEAKSKMENLKEESKSKMGNLKEKTKETFENIKNEFTGNLEMSDMLSQARINFEKLLKMEDSVKKDMLKDAKAIIFLSTMKSGLGVSGVIGSGVMITKMDNDDQSKWSGPIAVGLTGISIGLNAGFEKADNIIIVRDEQLLKQLSFERELQLSGDIEYVVGKTGHSSSFPLTTKEHESLPMTAYSMTKGAYVSLSLTGEVLKVKNDCNEEFYKQKVDVDDIINHKIKIPNNKDYNNLIKLVNNYYSSINNNKTTNTMKSDQKKMSRL